MTAETGNTILVLFGVAALVGIGGTCTVITLAAWLVEKMKDKE